MKYTRTILLVGTFICALTVHAQSILISENFEGFAADTNLDNITTAKYDFTSDKAFDAADTTSNTLGFYAGTGSNWITKTDPLNSGNMTLWLSGGDNHSNEGRGIYMMRLDPTGGGAFGSGTVTIDYSFRMMRDGANGNSPTSFDVAWVSRPSSLDDGSENLDMFSWAGETIDQSFSTSGDESTWVTVSGSISADLSLLDTTSPYSTGIRVDPTNGGWVSGGQGLYYVDDFSVSVTAVPEPRTYALMFGFLALGFVLRRRFKK